MLKLEERRSTVINLVNQIIDELKMMRDELERNESGAQSKCRDLETKLDFVEKMTTCLDSNIAAYNDFDLLEMEQAMMAALAEVESYDVDTSTTVAFVPGRINDELIMDIITLGTRVKRHG